MVGVATVGILLAYVEKLCRLILSPPQNAGRHFLGVYQFLQFYVRSEEVLDTFFDPCSKILCRWGEWRVVLALQSKLYVDRTKETLARPTHGPSEVMTEDVRLKSQSDLRRYFLFFCTMPWMVPLHGTS